MAKRLQLVIEDPWLDPYEPDINQRHSFYLDRLEFIQKNFKSLKNFASADSYLGFNFDMKQEGGCTWIGYLKQLCLLRRYFLFLK